MFTVYSNIIVCKGNYMEIMLRLIKFHICLLFGEILFIVLMERATSIEDRDRKVYPLKFRVN